MNLLPQVQKICWLWFWFVSSYINVEAAILRHWLWYVFVQMCGFSQWTLVSNSSLIAPTQEGNSHHIQPSQEYFFIAVPPLYLFLRIRNNPLFPRKKATTLTCSEFGGSGGKEHRHREQRQQRHLFPPIKDSAWLSLSRAEADSL